MPHRLDVELATPGCRQLVTSARYGPPSRRLCERPLEWHHASGWWRCPVHGAQVAGSTLARQRCRTIAA